MRRGLCRHLLIFTALACAVPAAAQQAEDARAGAEDARPTFVLAPTVSLADVGLDTNILATSLDPRRDTTGRLTLQAEPASHLGHIDLRGRMNVGVAYFRQYTQMRSVDTDNMGRLDVRMNRVTLYGAGSVLRSSDVFGPEIDIRTRRTQTGVEGGGGVRVTRRIQLTATARHTQVAFDAGEVLFDAILRDALSRGTDTMEFQVRTDLTPLTTFVVLTDGQRDRFDYTPERNTRSARVMAGIDAKPSAAIEGQASVGYRMFHPSDPAAHDVSTIAASADLAYTLAESVRFGVRVKRDLGNSYSLTQRYYVATDVQGTVTHRLTPSWDVTAMAGRQYLTYPEIGLAAGPDEPPMPAGRSDHYLRFALGVTARIGRRSTVTVTGESYHRDSQLTGEAYDRLRLVSSLGISF